MTHILSDKVYVEKLVCDINKLIHNKQKSSDKQAIISRYTRGLASKPKILNYRHENNKYFTTTENILNSAKFSYSGIVNTLEQYRLNISLFRNRIMSLDDSNDITSIITKEYDTLIDQLYITCLHFFNMEILDNNVSKRAIFEFDGVNVDRNVRITYVSHSGNVINDDVAKIDNVLLTISDMVLTIQIGDFVFNFYKSAGIETFSPTILIDKLNMYESDVIQLENQITKNINIITQAVEILNAIKLIST